MIKNLLSLIGILLLITNVSYSQTVNINEARSIAKNHLLTVNISTLKSARLKRENIQFKAAKIGVENKDTLFYILNDSVNNAFVIVSADERVWPILGYSTQGTFDEANQPDAFKAWMEERGKEIAYIKANNLQPDAKTIIEWTQLKSATTASQTLGVEPLLKTTWDQGCYYNEQCPADTQGSCGHVPTGCVATAMAQIMKYWNYPEKGVGSSFLDSKYGQQFADFGASTYNWQQMPNALTSSNSEVAKLMFHCGVATSVWYCIGGSSIYTGNVPGALISNFSYSPDMRYLSRGTTNATDWINMLKQELDAKRPVIYSGVSSIGHAFICDGYQNENYFHFNWGWGGYLDGYFYVENMNPYIAFNKRQEIIVNICPNNLPQGYHGFSLAINSKQITANKTITPISLISSVNWTATSDQTWLKLNSNAGNTGSAKIDLIAEENTTGISRTAFVTFSTVGFGKQTLTIIQTAKIALTAGNLRNVLEGKLAETKSITLEGTIDARDFRTLRDEMPILETIDLANTSIVAYSGAEGTYNGETRNYEANTIPGYAFKRNDEKDTISSNLYRFIFPISAKTIDSYAFHKCANLRTFDVPQSVIEIKNYSFSWCWFLTNVNIPGTVKMIESYAFGNCHKLQEINVDKSNANYSSQGGVLFDKSQTNLINCPPNKQGSYVIPTSVRVIKSNAFTLSLLNSIHIPANVDSIESGAIEFSNPSVIVDTNNPKYSSKDGILYDKNQTKLYFCPKSKKGNFTIPNGVNSIGTGAFGGCGDLTSLTISNSVTSIGGFAFNSCQGIETIEIPSSVASIGDNAFIFCYKLTSVKIPSSVKFIGNEVFIECSKLRSIIVGHSQPLKLQNDVFLNFDKTACTLYVPYGSKAAYQAADPWKDFKNIVEAANGFNLSTNSMQLSADAGSNSSVELKANVNWTVSCDKSWLTVSSMSGISNTALKFTVEANVSYIPRVATVIISSPGIEPQQIQVTQKASNATIYVNAGALASLFPANDLAQITSLALTGTIDARDFKTMRDNMPLLEEIDLSKATIVAYSGAEGTDNQSKIYPANTIPFSAFMKDWKGKKNLKSIVLPATLTEIDWSAFRDCDGLKTLVIPSTVIKIGGYVFMENDGLTSIEIPSSVTAIDGGIFWNCVNLCSLKVFNPVPIDFTKTRSENNFTGVNKTTCTLYVPYGSKTAYQSADQWKDFTNIVEMPLDHAPYLKSPLKNISAKPGANELIVDLKTNFADDDPNDVLSYALTSNSNSKIATVKLDGSNLILTFSAVETGLAEISVTATSNGKQITSKFQVTLGYPTGSDLSDQSKGFQVYPNPTDGIFYIRFYSVPKNGEQLVVSDLSGRMVMVKKIKSEDELIDLSGYASGVYLLKTSSPELGVHKIILK